MHFHLIAFIAFGVFLFGQCYGASVSDRYARRQERSHTYLPPYTITNYEDKSQIVPTYTTHSAESYQDLENGKHSLSSAYQSHNSYAPPPSGAAGLQYSTPQVSQSKFALNREHHHQQQQQQQLENDLLTPILMVEEAPTMWLTPNQNKTLEAAKILASSLLEANGEEPLSASSSNGVQLVNPYGLPDPNQLNSTDVVLVKSHKNAYVIPAQLTKDAQNPTALLELYAMRNQLEKAYTVNQFIFIIKPEKINFLNKLV